MRRAAIGAAAAVLAAAWWVAAAGLGVTGHMTAHMAAVAIAAPLLSYGIAGGRLDPAVRWPRLIAPLPASLLELFVVWGWHLPAARSAVAGSTGALLIEQSMFLAAGLLLWSACLGTRDAGTANRRLAAIGALLLTTMHMTLLGVLITLAPRPLFGTTGSDWLGASLSDLADQQLGGVVMLLIGAGSYLGGALLLLGSLLREVAPAMVRRWS